MTRVRTGSLVYRGKLSSHELGDLLVTKIEAAGRVSTSDLSRSLGITYEVMRSCCLHEGCMEHLELLRIKQYENGDITPVLKSLARQGRIEALPVAKGAVGWWQPNGWEDREIDIEVERALAEQLRPPAVDPKTLSSHDRAMVRGRALARLKDEHPDEFERYFWEEAGELVALGQLRSY